MLTPSSVWLITGCSSGLGRSLLELVLSKGHKVLSTARRVEALEDLRAKYPETCRLYRLDLTEAQAIPGAVSEALQAFGRIDVLVNNAGTGLVGALEEFEEDQIRSNFDTNFFGPLALMRAVLPTMRSQGSGHIINLSAAAAISNYAGFSIYGASKWALEGASESLAAEVKPLGIKVTLVQPGPFRTGFIDSMEKAGSQISAYDKTSGKFLSYLQSVNGHQPGDPGKAAGAILATAEAEAPPLRLVLGKYATEKVRTKLRGTERELGQWEPVGMPTDF